MRAAISTTALMALALASAAGAAAPTAGAEGSICRAVSPPYTVALVELYTSQGCSSCPPADRWLSKLQGGPAPLRAVPLALHVGYWDYIGWKDPFARREFNDRQRRLATHNGSGTVYTPEVFVGASELADWGSPDRVAAALAAVNARPPQASIELQAHWVAAAAGSVPAAQQLAVQVHWSADRSARDPQLLLAVKRGGVVCTAGGAPGGPWKRRTAGLGARDPLAQCAGRDPDGDERMAYL